MPEVLTVVMGGGKGARLFPLTKDRAKPAVPFGAKFRLVDIPLSNSINAGFRSIYVLTQFNSASLHLHIANTYIFDSFSRGFVEILAAEQTFERSTWYEGTADAVRKNFSHFRTQKPSHYLILSGDQLYRMDLLQFIRQHIDSGADATIAALPVTREAAVGFGILSVDKTGRIDEFTEKPPLSHNIESMRMPAVMGASLSNYALGRDYLGSMGIYAFRAAALETALEGDEADFGHQVIPQMIATKNVHAYLFDGFWEDIGTIDNFYRTSLALADDVPAFNLYDEHMPIYTRRRDLPPSKINAATLTHSLTADGCVISAGNINRSIIGIRTIVREGSTLDGVVCMGADYYEEPGGASVPAGHVVPPIGIGADSSIRGAIIDKNARIGTRCSIGMNGTPADGDYPACYVRDGIIVIPKNGIVPDGTTI